MAIDEMMILRIRICGLLLSIAQRIGFADAALPTQQTFALSSAWKR